MKKLEFNIWIKKYFIDEKEYYISKYELMDCGFPYNCATHYSKKNLIDFYHNYLNNVDFYLKFN
jgi:hypothetical protein